MSLKRFLYVDDNPDATELFEYAARELNIDPTICNNGTTALRLLDNEVFDAVILDLSLPVLDGLTISEEIRNNEALHSKKKPVCIVFYTAKTIDGAVERIGNRVGVQAIYQKGTTDLFQMLAEIKDMCGDKPMVIRHQNGETNAKMLICLVALILQIAVGCIFLWYNHRTEDWWALKWSQAVKQRDAVKINCDMNANGKEVLKIWATDQGLKPPAEMQTLFPCNYIEEK